ncbi:ankyrin repeat domain-containing protein [Pseudoxanthomonas sp.]|uniref:ankyrin repeat domain-containing protein n=1 Tax=Pseudoxanthomonas sp. TaxID=1871049 RepID=UPI0026056873|nr:ankyrin repeat domain-containing protein [Pseudoxanthomonas sp.]WDS35421.1 MAG: ankyrin repeat domain-containing protein [Pseudoxanthomonas sp.]
MPEPARRPMPAAWLALVVGLSLAALTYLGGWIAAAGALLAQPALALAVSWHARTRGPAGRDFLKRDLAALLGLWAVGFAVVAVLLVWPLQALRSGGSLAAAVGLSAVSGACLIGLWRTWPLWQAVECEGGTLSRQWRAMASREAGDWHGLAVAAAVAVAIGFGLSLAWPALWSSTLRGVGTALYVIALPLLHFGLQRTVRAGGLPVLEMPARPPAARVAPIVAPKPVAAAPTVEPARSAPVHAPALDAELYEAARGGRVERALQLIEAGANPRALPAAGARDQRSLAVLAAVLPDLRLLRLLIGKGIDLNQVHAGMTPLLAATRDSWHGRPDAVTTLLTNGADPRRADADGNTPLHHAARSSDPGVVALLRDAAAELDARNAEGVTPLGIACIAGNWRLAKFLLERGARPEPAGGQPVLLAAAGTEEDDPAGVQLLLKHKAKVDARGAGGRSALHAAALAGHGEILTALLAAGAAADLHDDAGNTPWLEAARSGNLVAIDILASAGVEIGAVDANGRNALMLAATGEQVSSTLIRRLLELGLDPAQRDAGGQRAVDVAAAAGRWALVSQLDPDYPLPNAVSVADSSQPPPDQAPLGLLREALERGDAADLDGLARLCSPVELGSLLHAPTLSTTPRVLQWLLRHGAVGEPRDVYGDVPLIASLARGPSALPAIRVLLDAGLSPAGGAGLARFLSACVQAGARDDAAARSLALELLQRGADPFAATVAGDQPLSLAVQLDWSPLVEALLAIGVDRETRDARGMSALHLATALGNVPMVRRLIASGAAPDARAADGQTPLGVALSSGRRDLADWLDWRVWPLPRRPLRSGDLPLAAIAGDVDAVRRLLDLGFDVDAPDAQGCSALLRAAGGGHGAVVDLLLARGADPQRTARTGATPLSAAVSMRQAAIVNALLDAGADIEYRLPGEVSVLMLAAALGLPDIAARLLTAGANVHAVDAQGLTPLHCAGLFGFIARDRSRLLALMDTLLLAGAEPDGAGASSVSPMLLLLGARAEPGTDCDEDVILAGLDRLLEEDIALDVRDPRGFGPLHLAALHGLLRVVQRLLRAGADPDLRDGLNRSPREVAIMRGFVDVAGELSPGVRPGSGAPIARYLRDQG